MMFIIFGTRGVTSTVASGLFSCPECGIGQKYRHQRAHRFFTLFFIPLIPLSTLGEYVECGTCKSTFKPEVLSYDPKRATHQWEALYVQGMLGVMVRMLAVEGKVSKDESSVVRGIYNHLTGLDISEADVTLRAAMVDPAAPVKADLTGLADLLNDNGKESVIRAAFVVAAADRRVTDGEEQLLYEIGAALEMSHTHVEAVVAEMAAKPAMERLQSVDQG